MRQPQGGLSVAVVANAKVMGKTMAGTRHRRHPHLTIGPPKGQSGWAENGAQTAEAWMAGLILQVLDQARLARIRV